MGWTSIQGVPWLVFVALFQMSVMVTGQIPNWDNLALFKTTGSYPAAAKTKTDTFESWYAVDGDRDPDDAKRRTCFITTTSSYGFAFFWVDLGKEHEVRYVTLVNRKVQAKSTDQLGPVNLLKNLAILCADTLQSHTSNQDQFFNKNNFTMCARQGPTSLRASEVKTFECESVCRGRYVVIAKFARKGEQFPLCEVEVYDTDHFPNVALNKPSYMYSYMSGSSSKGVFVSPRANDGHHMYLHADGTCIHSSNAGIIKTEYWTVDLLRDYRVRRIIHINRGDRNLGLYFKKFKYLILKEIHPWSIDKNDYIECFHRRTPLLDGEMLENNCGANAVGRYVMLYKYNAESRALLMCEMEVHGSPVEENLALNKPSQMTGEIGKRVTTSGKAVDGIVTGKVGAGSCVTLPGKDATEYWAVDLRGLYRIRNVVLVNRGEESTCIRAMGVGTNLMKVKDAQITGSSYYKKWTYTKGRLWNNEFAYGTDAWCPGTTKESEYLQIDFGKVVLISGMTIAGGYYTFAYQVYVQYSVDGSTFQFIKDPKGNKLTMPGTYSYFYYMRTVWWPKQTYLRKVRVGGKDKKYYRYPCFRIEFHGCWDPQNSLRNFKIKTAKYMSDYASGSSKVQTCFEQSGDFPPGYTRPLNCKEQPLARHVILEKFTPKGQSPASLTFCELEVYGKKHDGNLAYRKPTKQSSTYWKWSSNLAVDGNSASNMTAQLSCSQTLSKVKMCHNTGHNWWMVDLEGTYDVGKVVVVTHAGCCGDCLQDFMVLVADSFDDKNYNASKYKMCYFHEGKLKPSQVKALHCNYGAKGRYVIIQAPDGYPLTLCEVKVYPRYKFDDNIAFGKPTDQSSNGDGRRGFSNSAVDGWKSTSFADGSCTLTDGESDEAWWHVDLMNTYRIRKIVLVNRDDNVGRRLSNFKVAITQKHIPFELSKVPSELCHTQTAPLGNGEVKTMYCANKPKGRHVTILKEQSARSPLSLCEVEVYGTKEENNLAWKKPTASAHDKKDPTHFKAVDGKVAPFYYDGSCSTSTEDQDEHWWRVDLQKQYYVDRVLITNRVDKNAHQLRNYRVMLFEDLGKNWPNGELHRLCADRRDSLYDGGDILQIKCAPYTWGKILTIIKTNSYGEALTLCEVEAFGKEYVAPTGFHPNLARGKKAVMNAKLKDTGVGPYLTDGQVSIDGTTCAKTPATQDTEWMMVDLGQVTNISKVELYIGPTCCDNQQKLMAVLMDTYDPSLLNQISPNAWVVTTTPPAGPTTTPATTSTQFYKSCGTFSGRVSPGQRLYIPCKAGAAGRFLFIMKNPAKGHPLHLCEILAYSGGQTTTHPKRKKRSISMGEINAEQLMSNAGLADFLTID